MLEIWQKVFKIPFLYFMFRVSLYLFLYIDTIWVSLSDPSVKKKNFYLPIMVLHFQ